MITDITISEELTKAKSGVYMITFSDGRFYIGSSKCLNDRLKSHKKAILSDFIGRTTCKPLSIMSGFSGSVFFSLVERVDSINKRDLINREYYYIRSYSKNKLMLNDIRKSGDRKYLAAYVSKENKEAVITLSKKLNKTFGNMVEDLIEIGLSNIQV